MPPSAEDELTVPLADILTPRKNVTFAINYEVSIVDEFVADDPSRRKKRRGSTPLVTGGEKSEVQVVPASTSKEQADEFPLESSVTGLTPVHSPKTLGHPRQLCNAENSVPNLMGNQPFRIENTDKNATIQTGDKATEDETRQPMAEEGTRRSAREKQKREVPLARARVRYDMQAVPAPTRNREFLHRFPLWWLPSHKQQQGSSRGSGGDENEPPCGMCDASASPSQASPFLDNSSVVWVPSKRSEWEDTINEMTAVCTSAGIRRHMSTLGKSTGSKPFHAPLSREYIRDRVDIDDPLFGYQIRHKYGGWLQGFILWTNFTTWTHYFRWDSLDPKSGVLNTHNRNSSTIDADGSLAKELEGQPRSGDPLEHGVVFSGIAEIALVGALGCGEYLLRMALESILAKKKYKYVVLQATDSSKTFYERYGFLRVGAVCRYASRIHEVGGQTPIVGYRHWTHANESETSLQLHGGPSYMMCLKLPSPDECNVYDSTCVTCGHQVEGKKSSFIDAMLGLAVDQKPTIEQLGSTTPWSKPVKRSSLPSSTSVDTVETPASAPKKKPVRRVSGVQRSPPTKRKAVVIPNPPEDPVATKAKKPAPKQPLVDSELVQPPPAKKRKPSGTVESIPRDVLLSPPSDGQNLSYAQKQYHSVWLAVPPIPQPKTGRPPPKDRSHAESPQAEDFKNGRIQKKECSGCELYAGLPLVASQDSSQITSDLHSTASDLKPVSNGTDALHIDDNGTTDIPTQSEANQSKTKQPELRRSLRERPKRANLELYSTSSVFKDMTASSTSSGQDKPKSSEQKAAVQGEYVGNSRNQRETVSRNSHSKRTQKCDSDPKHALKYKNYHCIRGPDGRFVRVADIEPQTKTVKTAVSAGPTKSHRKSHRVDKSSLMKQKVKSYPRNRPHFYNRVVKRIGGPKQYYFVLHYDEAKATVRIVPMEARGLLTGKREGRPRFQAVIGENDSNFFTVPSSQYETVPAVMVMKTPYVAQEAWDIEDD